jgi:hypothetical protein
VSFSRVLFFPFPLILQEDKAKYEVSSVSPLVQDNNPAAASKTVESLSQRIRDYEDIVAEQKQSIVSLTDKLRKAFDQQKEMQA